MAIQRVRHPGSPSADVDLGPASASMARQVGEGKTALLTGIPDRASDEGIGTIERRQISQAEWDARRSLIQRPRPIDPEAEARREEAERRLVEQLHNPAPAIAAPVIEEPTVPEPTPLIRPELVFDAELVMPCERCAHEPVCAIRMSITPGNVRIITIPLDEALTLQPPAVVIDIRIITIPLDEALTLQPPAVVIDCRHFLDVVAPPKARTNIPRIIPKARRPAPAAGGGPGARVAWVGRMLDALVAADGDYTKAAEALGVKRTSLVGSMSKLRARTDLTEAERDVVLRKRRAR